MRANLQKAKEQKLIQLNLDTLPTILYDEGLCKELVNLTASDFETLFRQTLETTSTKDKSIIEIYLKALRRRIGAIYTLYRMLDAHGNLLYIGQTDDPIRRFKDHARKGWWLEVDKIQYEHLSSKAALDVAEKEAIMQERPKHNKTHKQPEPGSLGEYLRKRKQK